MKSIKFISHYNKRELNLRLPDDKAAKLLASENPIELYVEDGDRVCNGAEPRYFSKGQIMKLAFYLNGIDYWDSII